LRLRGALRPWTRALGCFFLCTSYLDDAGSPGKPTGYFVLVGIASRSAGLVTREMTIGGGVQPDNPKTWIHASTIFSAGRSLEGTSASRTSRGALKGSADRPIKLQHDASVAAHPKKSYPNQARWNWPLKIYAALDLFGRQARLASTTRPAHSRQD